MRVWGWQADHSGCGFYRVEQPLESLVGRGHLVGHDTRLTPGWLDRADVIVGQRVFKPGPSALWQGMARTGRGLVFEVDDDLFSIASSNAIAYRAYSRPAVRESLEANARVASRITVSTEPLAEVMSQYNADVRVVPNAVPDWLLEHDRPRRDRVTIGWGGSPTHAMDFEQVRGPLRQFMNRNPGVQFHCLGADYTSALRLPADQVRVTSWVDTVAGYLRAIDFDIAIAPLRPHRFNRSKSHLKALEAAALGIPVVASAVYPYEQFVRHGETGFLVRRDHEWGRYLRELVNDRQLREAMGAKARQQAAEWTASRLAPVWEEALTL